MQSILHLFLLFTLIFIIYSQSTTNDINQVRRKFSTKWSMKSTAIECGGLQENNEFISMEQWQ